MKGKQMMSLVAVTLLLAIVWCGHCQTTREPAKHDLYFSFITALSSSGGSTSSGGIPIIDFALQQINNDSRLLPDYRLQHTTVLDSEVHAATHAVTVLCAWYSL